MTTFCKNLRRLRLSKNMTQVQAACALDVSPQAVSRWECGTTLPDVTLLPQIARLYCVTIDDLYRETSIAYDNYAQRLGSIYRSTWDPADFARAEQEFRKLHQSRAATTEDLRLYAILHQYMIGYCIRKADALFDEALKSCSSQDSYWRIRRQKLYFMSMIGNGLENVDAQTRLIESGCTEFQEWLCLIAACQYAGLHSTAYRWFQKAASLYPGEAILFAYGGDICEALGDLENAFLYWDKALALDPAFCDAKHSKAYCYEKLGDYEKAYALWCDIADTLEKDGFEVEAGISRERAKRCEMHIL